ncbi:MAG: nitronate monooxygenase family protein [Thermodesulfobacteriota bacterium]
MKKINDFPPLRIGALTARTPIVQGGMGVGISLSGLASAVANQGGVGVISAAAIGLVNPPQPSLGYEEDCRAVLRREIRRARELSPQGILGVNIMVALTNYADMVRVSAEAGIDVIFSGAGLPLDLPGQLPEGAATLLSPIVSSPRAAAVISKRWLSRFDRLPDAVVVEGPKAGGHLGFSREQIDDPAFALEALVPEVVEALKPFEDKAGRAIPVIAAGGCYTGADIRKFLDMGAAAVQMGTRFVATEECDADPAFKQAYLDAKPGDDTIIQSPVGLPGRALMNPFLEQVGNGRKKPVNCPYHCIRTCDPEKSPYCISLALMSAQRGFTDRGFVFAGANVHRVDRITTVKELIDELREEYIQADVTA